MDKLTGQFKIRGGDRAGNPSEIDGRAAAFFDLDGTLIRGDTQDLEARYCLDRNRRSPDFILGLALSLAAVQLSRAGMISLTRQNAVYLRTYKGRTRDELSRIGQRLYRDVIAPRFFRDMTRRIQVHRARGDLIVLVSATTRHLILPVASEIKPDRVFCTDLEFDAAGRATGRALDGICAEGRKAELVRALAREKGIDLAASHAYSDHHSDIPFLSCTGQAHAVNPTPKMARHAGRKGWDIRYV